MTPIRLILLPSDPEWPVRQILFGPDDRVIEDTRLEYGGPWLGDTPTVLAVPGSDVAARRLVLPNGPRAQLEAAAGLILEEELSEASEAMRVAVGPAEPDGTRIVAAASAARAQGWLEIARGLGAEPQAVLPDFLLLPEPEDDTVVTADLGDRTAARGRDLLLSVEADLVPVLLAGRESRPLEDGPARMAAFARAARAPLLDLRPAAPGQAARPRALKLAAALAVLLVASPLLLDIARAVQEDGAARRDERRAIALARSALGSGTAIQDPAAQMRARRLELAAGASFGRTAAGLFAAVEAVEGARIEALMFEASGAARATLSYADYSDVERLRAAAAANGLELEEVSALDERGVRIGDFVVRAS